MNQSKLGYCLSNSIPGRKKKNGKKNPNTKNPTKTPKTKNNKIHTKKRPKSQTKNSPVKKTKSKTKQTKRKKNPPKKTNLTNKAPHKSTDGTCTTKHEKCYPFILEEYKQFWTSGKPRLLVVRRDLWQYFFKLHTQTKEYCSDYAETQSSSMKKKVLLSLTTPTEV